MLDTAFYVPDVPASSLRANVIALSEAQNHRCAYCKQPMVLWFPGKFKPPNYATLEHLIPRSHDGSETDWNYVAACSMCNQLRDIYPSPFEFERLVVGLMRNHRLRHLWHHHTPVQRRLIKYRVWTELAKLNQQFAWEKRAYFEGRA